MKKLITIFKVILAVVAFVLLIGDPPMDMSTGTILLIKLPAMGVLAYLALKVISKQGDGKTPMKDDVEI